MKCAVDLIDNQIIYNFSNQEMRQVEPIQKEIYQKVKEECRKYVEENDDVLGYESGEVIEDEKAMELICSCRYHHTTLLNIKRKNTYVDNLDKDWYKRICNIVSKVEKDKIRKEMFQSILDILNIELKDLYTDGELEEIKSSWINPYIS